MPPPSSISHLPSSHPAQRQRPKSPTRVLAETEAQWTFTEAELANTPSIQDGMSLAEEREKRASAINFMVQVGIMLKLPQITLSTASIFFHRFMMRASFKKERNGIPKLHHFQAAATALFLATKVEESCRKMKELVLAFCRVAQKNPNLVIDEQSKDWWRWRDCILHNEDVVLETLCFDLTVESPHRQMFDMMKWFGIEHNKKIRNAAWSFVTDINNTPLCLMVSSRTIAVASIYAALRHFGESIHDLNGRPWWESQNVRLKDILTVVTHLVKHYDPATNKIDGVGVATQSAESGSALYVGLANGGAEKVDETRLKNEQGAGSQSPYVPPGSERRPSNASSVGVKREREPTNGEAHANGVQQDERDSKRQRAELKPGVNGNNEGLVVHDPVAPHDQKLAEEQMRVQRSNEEAEKRVAAVEGAPQEASQESSQEAAKPADEVPAERHGKAEEAEASEEGEVEE